METETTQVLPQEDTWNPPGGDLDFNDLFGGAGDDSGLPSTNNAQTALEDTQSAEPVVDAAVTEPQVQTTPKRDDFFVATYRDKQTAERAINEKDQLIDRLRGMVRAATGEDPLKKGTSQSDTTTESRSYLTDPERYAQDLSKAAMEKNWNKYLQTQLAPVQEYLAQTIGPYAPQLQNMGKLSVVDNVAKDIPEFRTFYGSEQYQKVMEARPKLANAIQFAETNPSLGQDLQELYQIAWDSSQAMRLPELVKQNQQPSTKPNLIPRTPMQSQQRPGVVVPDRNGMGQPTKPGMTTSAGRKALMEELEAKGVLDARF